MSNLTLQFHIILPIPNLVKLSTNTHWPTYHTNPLKGLFVLHAKENALHRLDYPDWPSSPARSSSHNVKAYVKRWSVCLFSKPVRHKPYGDLQFLPIHTHCWKDLSMDFVTGLLISTD